MPLQERCERKSGAKEKRSETKTRVNERQKSENRETAIERIAIAMPCESQKRDGAERMDAGGKGKTVRRVPPMNSRSGKALSLCGKATSSWPWPERMKRCGLEGERMHMVEKVSGATEKVWKGTRKVKAEKAKERGRATRKVNGASGKEEEEMRKERANSAMTARAFTQAKATGTKVMASRMGIDTKKQKRRRNVPRLLWATDTAEVPGR
mmetsp:Transcript_110393/g.263102  ORF Transcript_110393/g.263102 Transcript_110393/m.263102 type:complete len:210 (-) Transcript_110393:530-1159(-)